MQYILSPRNRRILEQFALSNTLIAFDFDGTLAPIVENRRSARIMPSTKVSLTRLAVLYPCVVISGRGRNDVLHRMRGIKFKAVLGNHGIEPWSTSPAIESAVRRLVPICRSKLGQFRSVAIEDKRFSISIHYRNEIHKSAVRATVAKIMPTLGRVRIIGGKQVINILPAGAPHKGDALEQEMSKMHCSRAIYLGDDETDEDVFALSESKKVLSIRVGFSRSSLAGYYIRTQREIDRIIQRLVDLRSTV
jgi:trehalose 6-phosphate phosphatase